MNIRPATVLEIPELQLILKQLNTLMAAYQPESCREGVQAAEYLQKVIEEDNSDIVIAEENGSILGLAVVTEGQTPPYAVCVPHRYAYLTDLCVREGNRGQGVGTALLEGVREWAINRKLDYVELSVLEENKQAAALYHRVGYRDVLHRLRLDL